jgi:hypothetical protein
MKFKPGDRVRYLNSIGEGMVTKIIDSRMVMVTGDDGFAIPTLISELVKADPEGTGSAYFTSRQKEPEATTTSLTEEAPDMADEQSLSLPLHIIRNRKTEDIYLAFIPHDQKWLITGMVDIFLINNTSCDVIYNLYHRTWVGHYEGVDYGSLFAGTKLLLRTVDRESLSHWTEGCLQFLFFKEQTPVVIPPFNSAFRIDGKTFYKEGSYRESPLAGEKGIILKVATISSYMEETGKKEDSKPGSPDDASRPAGSLIHKHQTDPREAEVDLHIHELIDDSSNLDKSEILEFQKNYFIRCLDEAIQYNFTKVIFIHGVGNGILRTVLIDHLKKTEASDFSMPPWLNMASVRWRCV